MSTVAKSYYEGSDPVLAYCLGNSHIHPAMESLQKATLNVPRSMMLGIHVKERKKSFPFRNAVHFFWIVIGTQ